MSLVKQLLEIYGGNPYHAQARVSPQNGSMYYELIEEPITEELIERHLKGEITLGSYPIHHESNNVKYVTWDVDSAGDIETAREIVHRIAVRLGNLPYVVTFSGNKGYHITLFFERAIQASVAKEIGEWVREAENLPKSGNPHVEVYPKQSHLDSTDDSERRSVGNLLKMPLGIHPLTHNKAVFVNIRNGFENGIKLAPEEVLTYRVSIEEFIALRETDRVTMESLGRAIAVEWDSGRRHDLCLYLAGYLAQIGWTFEQTWNLAEIILRERPDDDDHYNRRQAIQDTYKKFNRGATVAGFQSLSEIISGGLMKFISEEAPSLIASNIARQIDQTRFDKGASWQKERAIANLIWNWLTDRENGGRVIRVDPTGIGQEWNIFYFSQEQRTLISMEGSMFDDLIYSQFNLNMAEQFTQKVKGFLVRKARTQGERVEIHKRSVYKEGTLYVNLGGVNTYVLDGKNPPRAILNGDENTFFVTDNPNTIVPEFDTNVNVWKELVDNINFETSDEAPMRPEEQKQLLIAWILAFFFRKIMPTRPILSLLGLPGSGKTTAIRQILRMIEGLNKDVIGLTDERSDAWRSVLENNSMVVLDNLEESRTKWLSRALDLVATGQVIQIRKLYTTNDTYSFQPDIFVALTAVEMPFSKDTVFERMLILNMKKLSTFTPAYIIEENLRTNLAGLWGDLLINLNEVVKILNTESPPKIAMQIRMADFAHFATWISKASFLDSENLESGLRYLGTAQQAALALSENSVYPILLEWVEENPEEAAQFRKVGSLYSILKERSQQKGRPFYWKTNQNLSRHLLAMENALENSLGMVSKKIYDSSKGREHVEYKFIPFGDMELTSSEESSDNQNPFSINLQRGE